MADRPPKKGKGKGKNPQSGGQQQQGQQQPKASGSNQGQQKPKSQQGPQQSGSKGGQHVQPQKAQQPPQQTPQKSAWGQKPAQSAWQKPVQLAQNVATLPANAPSSSSPDQPKQAKPSTSRPSAKNVKKMEAQFSDLSLGPPEPSYKFDQYAPKKAGTLGRKMDLITNYFRMAVRPMTIYHYNIEIIPMDMREGGDQAEQKKVVKRKKIPKEINLIVFDELWKKNSNVFKSEPVFDGEKNIYTVDSLEFNSYEKNFQVQITEGGNRKSTFRVRITTPDDSHQIDLTNINQVSSTDFKVSETQALDIILKNGPRRFKLSIGMNLFLRTLDLRKLDKDRQNAIRTYLGENKEMAFGFYQSARMTESGLMLNIDRAAIVFNKGGPLIRIIENIISESRSTFRNVVQFSLARERFDDRDKKSVEQELKMLKMQVNHISYRPKFTISRFSQESISRVTFEENQPDGSKKRTSVFDYFNRTYAEWLQTNNLRLNPNLPCVQVGRDRPKFFPLEVCELIDDQHSTKKLKAKLQAEMTRRAGQQKPYERFNEIKENLQAVLNDSKRTGKDYLEQFGVKIDPNFVKVTSRVLQQPSLRYKGKAFDPGTEGAWDMSRSRLQFSSSINLGSDWMIINISNSQRGRYGSGCKRETIDQFAQELIKKSRELGLPIDAPTFIDYSCSYDGRGTLKRNLFDKYLQKYPKLKIMVCFIPKVDEIYHELKTVAELKTTNGLVTQCVSQDNERKCTQHTFVANVLLKINAKLQGVNVILDQPCRPVLLTKCTMIVGLDVTHPAPADKLSQSIAACVGTYDKDFTKYYARVVVQPKPKKEIVDLASMMTDLLNRFRAANKRLPVYIVIYRDGVSEGQFDEVMVKELGKLKESFKTFQNDDGSVYQPKIAFLVVQKRNHTRFMIADPRQAPKNGNVHPGTVVDRTITSNVLFDFYVVAHQGAIGTSRPVHYYVLYDETKAPADEIQKMTYFLSYLYPRCNRSISVPPPVMYAHLSAKRARSHIFILDESDGRSTVSSGSGGEYRQLSPAETESMNKQLMVKPNLNGVLYYI